MDGSYWWQHGPRSPHQGGRLLHPTGRVQDRQGGLPHPPQLSHVQDVLL